MVQAFHAVVPQIFRRNFRRALRFQAEHGLEEMNREKNQDNGKDADY